MLSFESRNPFFHFMESKINKFVNVKYKNWNVCSIDINGMLAENSFKMYFVLKLSHRT